MTEKRFHWVCGYSVQKSAGWEGQVRCSMCGRWHGSWDAVATEPTVLVPARWRRKGATR